MKKILFLLLFLFTAPLFGQTYISFPKLTKGSASITFVASGDVIDTLVTGTLSGGGTVSLSGENYLSLSGSALTAHAVNLSGTNATGILAAARFPALTGDVTTSSGAISTTIASNAVTYAKMQAISGTSLLLGSSATTTAVQEITLGTGLSMSGTTLTSGAGSGTVSITSSIVDLTSPASWIVKDTLNTANTLIHVTTKPSVPQFYYVVQSADIPTNTNILNYMAVIAIGGKNRDAANARTVNWIGCRGTNPATEFTPASASVSTSASQFWSSYLWFSKTNVSAGDTIAVKLWSSIADTTDFRYATIYFLPREITGGSNYNYFYGQTNATTNVPWDDVTIVKGANSGVTYSSLVNVPCATFMDSASSSSIILVGITNTVLQPLYTIGLNQYLAFSNTGGGTVIDVNGAGTTNASATLIQFPASNGTARRIRYLRKITYSVH